MTMLVLGHADAASADNFQDDCVDKAPSKVIL